MVIADSARITSSKVFSQSFANIYNLLNNRVNVQDPLHPTDTETKRSRKFVYRRQPNFGRNFGGFPFIIIRATMPKSKTGSADASRTMKDFFHDIEVYAQDTRSDELGDPAGAETRDQIVDDIVKTLDNTANKKALSYQGQGRMGYEVEIDDEADLDGKTLFAAMFDLRFENSLIS